MNKDSPRSQNDPRAHSLSKGRAALVHSTIWQHPAVHAELARIASEEHLSFSQVGATACEQWVHQRLHDRHEALLYPVVRQLVRDENRTLGNRLVFFQMRTAFAAEQTRILTTNMLSRFLKYLGVPDETFNNLVDQSNKMAKRNIIARNPDFKSLIEEWWQTEPEEWPGKNAASKPDHKTKPDREEKR